MNSEEQNTATSAAQAAKSSPAKVDLNTGEEAAAATATKSEENASNAPPAGTTEEELDATVRISKDSQVRKLISFVMGRLERGGTVTLQALNQCVHKAITVALISRDRLGNIYQVNSLLVVQENDPKAAAGNPDADTAQVEDKDARIRTTSGIQIILSKSPLDTNEVGYEQPKPKGFVQQIRQKRYQDRRQRQDEIRAAEQKAAAEKAATEKPSKRRNASNRRRDQTAEKAAPEAKDQQASGGKTQRRRQSRKPEKQQEKDTHLQNADQEPVGKSRRRRQRNANRSKTDDKDQRSRSEEEVQPTSQGGKRQNRSRRDADQPREQNRREAPPPQVKQENNSRRSPPDIDYMGREVPRGNRRMNNTPAYPQYPNHGAGGRNNSGYQRRGAPYEVGQSYRYMPDFNHEESQPYFAQRYQPQMHPQGRRGGFRGNRGGGDQQARPGYFPASRRPQRPDQLMDDLSYGGGQQRRQQQFPVNGYRRD